MTSNPTSDPESARALLWWHGVPEDVIDGALCLHAQELAAVQRREAAVWGVDTAAGKRILGAADLIDPASAAAPAVSSVVGQATRDRIAEAPADRAVEELAALAVNTGRALGDEKRHYEIACHENARLRATVERVRRLHDALDAETDLTSPDDEITRGAAARKIAAALDGWTDPAELRRLADEAQQTCGCGEPSTPGTVHRTDGPCYVDEAQQQPETERGPRGTVPGCTCPHPDSEHSIYGCADGCACEWMPKRRKRPPMDPVHILGIKAGEAQQSAVGARQPDTQTQAHPPQHAWRVETRDPLADQWAPGSHFAHRPAALERWETANRNAPLWRDGTPVERRIVRETTTYTVEVEHQPASSAVPGRSAATDTHEETDRIVAYVLAANTDLHCLRCAPSPRGDIWTSVAADELDDGGLCAKCGVDVLIPQNGAEQ